MRSVERVKPLQWISGVTIVLVAAFALWKLSAGWSMDDFVEATRQLPHRWLIASFTVLPLVGAPISIFLMAVGLKYGMAVGLLITGMCMAVHHLTAWFVAHTWLREKLERWLDKFDYEIPSIPKQHQTWFMFAFALAPGLAYVIKLYAIALTDMPLRKYFWVGWPVYTLSSFVLIGMGDAAGNTNRWLLLAMGICLVLGVGFTWWLKRNMDSRTSPEFDREETVDTPNRGQSPLNATS